MRGNISRLLLTTMVLILTVTACGPEGTPTPPVPTSPRAVTDTPTLALTPTLLATAPSGPPVTSTSTPTQVAPGETPRPTMQPMAPLGGRWIWVEDSDGTRPSAGSECALVFSNDGSLDLNCIKPGEELHDQGTYSVTDATPSGGIITLELPGIAIMVEPSPYTITADGLTLPFTLISGEPGTSLWQEQPRPLINELDFVAVAYQIYEEALVSGTSDGEAADAAAAALTGRDFALELRYASSAASFAMHEATESGTVLASPPPTAPLRQVILNAQKTAIRVMKENGRVYYIILKPKMPKDDEFRQHPAAGPLTPGFFAQDPRTHLYMQVSSGPNDPANHTAALLFPMHRQRNYRKGRYFTFKNSGEDPDALRDQVLRAGYQASDITVAEDDDVSPKFIADELLKNPGVFYISTHGASGTYQDGSGGFLLVTGTKVVPRAGQSRDDALVAAVLALGLPNYLLETLSPATVQVDRFQAELFLAVGDPFFQALRDNNPGWNMSRSLVYLDACESTASPSAVTLFSPAALLGWRTTVDTRVSVRYSQHFFRNAVRKTHSAREIWDQTWRVLTTRQAIYEEDTLLDDSDPWLRGGLAAEITNFEGYGLDGQSYKRLGDGLYPNTLPDVVFWLVWLGRWNQDPDTASSNLQSCYDQVWSQGRKGLGVSPLCTAGYLGAHAPTAQEVKEARQLINGEPRPILGGRWTMADSIPYADD